MCNSGFVFSLYFMQIFRKEPFFYGHDNHDQLVKIAKVTFVAVCHCKFLRYLDVVVVHSNFIF